jgi:hypothetical protein
MTADTSKPEWRAGPSSTTRLARRVLIALFLIMAAGSVVWLLHRTDPRDQPSSGIVIVRGIKPSSPDLQQALSPPPADQPLSNSIDLATLKKLVVVRFPTLANAVVACEDVCTITSEGSDEVDQTVAADQLPYLDRLENYLRAMGFEPVDKLMIEESGDGRTILRLRFSKPTKRR